MPVPPCRSCLSECVSMREFANGLTPAHLIAPGRDPKVTTAATSPASATETPAPCRKFATASAMTVIHAMLISRAAVHRFGLRIGPGRAVDDAC